MTPPGNPVPDLPAEALHALRQGRTIDAVRIVRETGGIGLKDAAERVDAAIARNPSLRATARRPPVIAALGDYLASGWKLPLAAGLGADDRGSTNAGFFRANAASALTRLLHAADLDGRPIAAVIEDDLLGSHVDVDH